MKVLLKFTLLWVTESRLFAFHVERETESETERDRERETRPDLLLRPVCSFLHAAFNRDASYGVNPFTPAAAHRMLQEQLSLLEIKHSGVFSYRKITNDRVV